MTSSILTHAGYKTGLTISPYVLNFRERFQINGQMMSPRTLASLTRKVLDAADAIIAEGGEGPVEFEAVTAIAFLWFARQKCDFAVVETGLGGRYDATNVIPAPLVAAITRIGMDHTEILGDTLAEIAAEKAGIIKEGSVVVCYPEQPEEAMGPLLTAAANAHTSLVVPDTADLQQLKCRPLENYVDYGGYRALLQFPGKHQANHAAMAVEIALALWREYHYEIPDEAIETGLRDAKMPARIEVMRRHPLLLLDGCHNADGTAALAATLKEAGYDGNLVAVLGLLKDKDHSKMLENLAPCFEKVFTVTPDSPRAMTGRRTGGGSQVPYWMPKPPPAWQRPSALRWITPMKTTWHGVVVCGSLYLASSGPSTAAQRSGKVTPIPTKYAHSALYTGNIPQQQGAFCCYYQK